MQLWKILRDGKYRVSSCIYSIESVKIYFLDPLLEEYLFEWFHICAYIVTRVALYVLWKLLPTEKIIEPHDQDPFQWNQQKWKETSNNDTIIWVVLPDKGKKWRNQESLSYSKRVSSHSYLFSKKLRIFFPIIEIQYILNAIYKYRHSTSFYMFSDSE